jgi:hypothetical protein
MKMVSFQPYAPAAFTPRVNLVLIFKAESTPGHMELSDVTEKILATLGTDPGTFRLVAQCLNHYATPGFCACHEGIWRRKSAAPLTLNRDTTCKLEVRFTPRSHDLEKKFSFPLESKTTRATEPVLSPSAVQSVAQSLHPRRCTTQRKKSRLTGPQIKIKYKAQTGVLSYFLHRGAYRFRCLYKIVVRFQARPRVPPPPSKTSRPALRRTHPITQW